MSRRRMTWTRNASAAPAMPGYQEPSIHPAAYPDPDADAYMNGDPSAWAEDPHPGPYPNPPPPPALPGQQGPEGHPATDPAHYFPKAASRQLRAAMQHKAAKCIRIAQSMLGRKASVASIEDQALDLMNLSDRQIQAALARLANMPMAGFPMAEEMPMAGFDAMAEEMSMANMTLTPGVTADDLMLDDSMLDDSMSDDMMLAGMLAEESGGETEDDALLAEMFAEEHAPVAGFPMAGMNPMAMHMAARRRSAKKSEEVEAEEVETAEEEAKSEAGAASKAAYFRRLASFWAKKAGVDSPAPYDQMPGSQNAPEHYNFRSEGVLAAKSAKKSEEVEADEMLAEMESEEAEKPAEKKAKKAEEPESDAEAEAEEESADKAASYLAGDEDPMADLMDDGDFAADEELASLYGMKQAKKADEDEEEGGEEEIEETEEEVEVASKKAALRPQPRKASNGVRSLGVVSKVASSEIHDLAKLWESAPDVSKIFG